MTGERVLVVGAGPAGLFVTAELARHGVRARLVEQANTAPHEARATSLKPGVLELLESADAVAPLLDVANHVRTVRMRDGDLVEFGSSSYAGIDCRYDFMLQVPQYETVRVLEERLVGLGGQVERGVGVRSVDTGESDRVVVQLEHADGRSEVAEPDAVIGAGGAHSITRRAMNQPLEGTTYPGEFLVADVGLECPLAHDEAHFVFGPHGYMNLAGLPGGRWICFLQLDLGERIDSAADVATGIRRRLGAARHRDGLGGSADTDLDVAWFSTFRMQRRIVPRLADRRLFLIGDAAHLASTFSGQGQNAALQDAYDLAWKMAFVRRGAASHALLDAYDVERSTADRHILDVSNEVHENVVAIATSIGSGGDPPRGATDPVTAALRRDASAMIDIDYAGSPIVRDLVGDADASVDAAPRPGMRYPDWNRFDSTSHHILAFGPIDDTPAFQRMTRRWSGVAPASHDPGVAAARAGVPRGGLVLIRPDGHVGFRSSSTDLDAIRALDAHLSSYLIAPA